jgi:hypothetical protein
MARLQERGYTIAGHPADIALFRDPMGDRTDLPFIIDPVRLDRELADATSGMYAVRAVAMPILAQPYQAGAPEVEGLTRLHAAGLRIEEVAVDMRERASGESKLQGKKALMVVLTIAGTLIAVKRARRH